MRSSSFSSNAAVLLATEAVDGFDLLATFLLRIVGAGWQSLLRRKHLNFNLVFVANGLHLNCG